MAYALETNPLTSTNYHAGVDHSEVITLADVARLGGRITRVRVIGESRVASVSYVHATLRDGSTVNVDLSGIPSSFPWYTLKTRLVEWARGQGVYGKGVGLLDPAVLSTLK
jgi:hypothetical protein